MPIRLATAVQLQFMQQVALHRRPFVVDDREHHGVARAAIRMTLVIADHPVLFRAETPYGGARGMAAPTRFKAAGVAAQRSERVGAKQQLAPGIPPRSLQTFRILAVTAIDSRLAHTCAQLR